MPVTDFKLIRPSASAYGDCRVLALLVFQNASCVSVRQEAYQGFSAQVYWDLYFFHDFVTFKSGDVKDLLEDCEVDA